MSLLAKVRGSIRLCIITLPWVKYYFETERLTLRPLEEADIDSLVEKINHPLIADTTLLIPHPYSRGDAEDWLVKVKQAHAEGKSLNLMMILKEPEKLIGGIALEKINQTHKSAELAYWLGVDFWRNGYTAEAASRLVDYAFEEMNFERIWAICMMRNPASARVMEKIGMKHEGVARREYIKNGVHEDFNHYAILRSDWEEMR